MFRVLQSRWSETGSTASRLRFEVDRGDRYLLIDDRRAYHLGFGCQTCSFLFERLSGANQAVQIEATADALRLGVESLDDEIVSVIAQGIPAGEYNVMLAESAVTQTAPGDRHDYFVSEQIALWGEDTFWCLPHDPRVAYFRAGDQDIGERRRLFNFIVPMFPTKWLTMSTVAEYKEALRTKASGTAVSIAVLDVRGPATFAGEPWPDPEEHWCLTHYLLDGHHKLHAASEMGKPLRLLSFLASTQGTATREQIERTVALMSGA